MESIKVICLLNNITNPYRKNTINQQNVTACQFERTSTRIQTSLMKFTRMQGSSIHSKLQLVHEERSQLRWFDEMSILLFAEALTMIEL
jgi:hypothetical protein